MSDIQNEKRPEKQERLRAEARARQEVYDKLTPQQKIDRLNDGAYAARKQRAQLESQLEK